MLLTRPGWQRRARDTAVISMPIPNPWWKCHMSRNLYLLKKILLSIWSHCYRDHGSILLWRNRALLSGSHLFKPLETYIMYATPVQSPPRIKYWTKNSRHSVLKAPPLWSIFIGLMRLFLFLSVAWSKRALAIVFQPRVDHGWLGMLPWRRPHFHSAVDATSKTRTKDGGGKDIMNDAVWWMKSTMEKWA